MAACPNDKANIIFTSDKGRCLTAAQDIAADETILTERPLVCAQFLWNAAYGYTACGHCMRSLEPTRDLCARLLTVPDFCLPRPECCPRFQKPAPIKCERCEVVYCSIICKQMAFTEYHTTLCLNVENPRTSAILNLQDIWKNMHFPPETASIMVLARILAMIMQSPDPQNVFLHFKTFCNKSENQSAMLVHKFLGEKFIGNIHLLRNSMSELFSSPLVSDWFTEAGFNSLFALIATNGQGIGTSALSEWVSVCNDLQLEDTHRTQLDEFIDTLYEKLDEAAGQFLNAEGSGLYKNQSSTNHSCYPNAESTFPLNDYTVVLKALRPIARGQEISISYLSECQLQWSRHSRQKYLRSNYLFNCACEKCVSQSGDPDVTSSEEEDEEEEAEVQNGNQMLGGEAGIVHQDDDVIMN